MEIINKPEIDYNVTCDFCGCEYIFKDGDIKHTFREYGDYRLNQVVQQHLVYVECPICETRHYIEYNKGKKDGKNK